MKPIVLKLSFKKVLILIIISTIILGTIFRFYHLDQKVYWYDEAFTTLRLSGYTRFEFVNSEFNGNIIGVDDLLKYQKLNSHRGVLAIIQSLTEDVHPPLYFLLLWFWAKIFGDSIYAIRAFSATVSVLTFPTFFWLTSEVFNNLKKLNQAKTKLISWIAVSLLAISPFQVVYGQEARMYSLFCFAIIFSNASFLSALRTKTRFSWLLYSFSLVIGFYTHLFYFFNVIGHSIYLVWSERFRISKAVVNYEISLMISLVSFIPWILVIVTNLTRVQQVSSVKQIQASWFDLIKFWLKNLTRIFIDLQIGNSEYFAIILTFVILTAILVLLFKASAKSILFIASLTLSIALPLALSDLILGTNLSTKSRYLFQFYLGIEILIAYFLGFYLLARNSLIKKTALSLYLMILLMGFISCLDFSQNQTWWNKSFSKINYQIATTINSVENPLVISNTHEFNVIDLLSLSHLFHPNVKFSLFLGLNFPEISEPELYDTIFIYNISDELHQVLEKNFLIKDVGYKLVTIHKNQNN
jgi:uncharacterized membrane protein